LQYILVQHEKQGFRNKRYQNRVTDNEEKVMKFSELAIKRYSVRKFKSQTIEKRKLTAVLEAARMAPSAVNYQPWHFIVIQDPENLKKIQKTYHRDWFKTAPVVIMACADHSQSWKRGIDGKDFADIDVSIAIDHLMLQAAEMDLGTCWVCNFDTHRCAESFRLPGYITPVALIPIGYPDCESVSLKKRKPLEDIVHWETFEGEDPESV
jgi:nitroreductase